MASAAAVASHRDLAYLIADLPRGAVSTLFRKVTKQYGSAPCRTDKTPRGLVRTPRRRAPSGQADPTAPCSERPDRVIDRPVRLARRVQPRASPGRASAMRR